MKLTREAYKKMTKKQLFDHCDYCWKHLYCRCDSCTIQTERGIYSYELHLPVNTRRRLF